MANIRVSAAVSTVLAVAASATVMTVSAAGGATAVATPTSSIRLTAFVVPIKALEEQTVTMSDFRAFDIGQISIDIALVTDDVAITFDTSFNDSVTPTDSINRIINSSVDFDPSDDDVDPDPITMADTDAKAVGKTLTDASAITDTDVKSVGKVATDSVTTAETINTKDVGKSLSDAAAAADTVNTFNVARVSTDAVTATDAPAKDFTRPDVADSVTTADESFRSPGLGKTDSVTATDTFGPFDIGVNPSDTATAVDSIGPFAVATVLADSVTISDFVAKTPGYEFDYDIVDADADPDPVTVSEVMAKEFARPDITDSATATDAPAFTVGDVQTDSVTMADVLASSPVKALDDSATGSDSTTLTSGKVATDTVTVADVLNSLNPIKVATDSVTGSDAVNLFAVTKGLTDSATMADSIATELILGQTTALYPDYVSMDDGGNFVFHRFRAARPDYTEMLGGSDSLFNSAYMQNASDSLAYENYTGIIGGPGLMLTAPLINGEFITYGYSTGAGLVVNFHYTDAADRTVGGYQFNQTPIL